MAREPQRREQPAHLSAAIGQLRAAVMAHQPDDGSRQWYVDEHVIDCDAEEFWAVIARALADDPGCR